MAGEYEDLERVPDEVAIVMAAEELCSQEAWEHESIRRVPELAGIQDAHEFHRWQYYLEQLDERDPQIMAEDLAQAVYCLDAAEEQDAAGWIEDEHGGAVFHPYL